MRCFIYEVNFLFFKNILLFLLESGVSPYNILRDLWVFKYDPSKVRERITIAKRANSKKIMPWMVRCKQSVFQRYLNRTKETNELLANRSIEDYLAEKLKCDMDMVNYIIANNPSIRNIHITKLQDSLDYFLSLGYTAYHIAQAPRVLCNSLQTTKERMNEINDLDVKLNSLVILCKSKTEYSKHLTYLRRRKGIKDSSKDLITEKVNSK
uniref:Putative transcription termination factor mitochondrial isoform x2 n=1 Tax=Xenopsylla cheopis TaxID=163159 RepID=A0A6M2E2N0_XENCH